LFYTYDLARKGATVDEDLVKSGLDADVVWEVEDAFLPNYDNDDFDSATSLFAIWIGINDLVNSYLGDEQPSEINPDVIDRYQELVEELYDVGARNFLFINVPPVNRAPIVTQSSASDTRIPLMEADIADYNPRVNDLARQIADIGDTTVFVYDANTLFNNVIDDPSQYDETSVYQNTDTYCGDYRK
jgi:phospholipase/lecithinase/hemolysin